MQDQCEGCVTEAVKSEEVFIKKCVILSIIRIHNLNRTETSYTFVWTSLLMVGFSYVVLHCAHLPFRFTVYKAFIFWRTAESRGLLIGLD